ncbi:MAG: MaoC family dehydratase N-terminal domain-containing protein [Actinomycetota bacterium]
MNAGAEGKTYPPVTLVVDPARVEHFAHSVGAAGLPGVPPTFATAGEFTAFPDIVDDPELGLHFARVLHGEQEYEWFRPFVPGETITITSHIAQIRQRGPLGFCTIESELRDEAGELVVRAVCTFLERGEPEGANA